MAPSAWRVTAFLLLGFAAGTPAQAGGQQTGARLSAAARGDSGRAAGDSGVAMTKAAARTGDPETGALGGLPERAVLRETFTYGGGPRDPFVSLIKTAHAGPELGDLQLVAIYEDMRYSGNSVAILREKTGGKRHKLRAGDQVGRLRVARVTAKDVVFTIEDFGYERQETLSLRKQEDVIP